MAYRSAIHETTANAPAKIVFGNELRLPADLQFKTHQTSNSTVNDYIQNLREKLDGVH